MRFVSQMEQDYEEVRELANSVAQRTIKFINDEASSVHGSLKIASVYTSESGEWKLGGFEVLSNVKDDDAIIYVRLRHANAANSMGTTNTARPMAVLCQTQGGTLLLSSQTPGGTPSSGVHTQP